jgi:hypothetical protein
LKRSSLSGEEVPQLVSVQRCSVIDSWELYRHDRRLVRVGMVPHPPSAEGPPSRGTSPVPQEGLAGAPEAGVEVSAMPGVVVVTLVVIVVVATHGPIERLVVAGVAAGSCLAAFTLAFLLTLAFTRALVPLTLLLALKPLQGALPSMSRRGSAARTPSSSRPPRPPCSRGGFGRCVGKWERASRGAPSGKP